MLEFEVGLFIQDQRLAVSRSPHDMVLTKLFTTELHLRTFSLVRCVFLSSNLNLLQIADSSADVFKFEFASKC